MGQQTIAVGATYNDGTGDKPRDAMVKCNANFTENYAAITKLQASIEYLNMVTDFSADPTGATDSTAAFQAALDYAGVHGSQKFFLPKGVYKIAGALQNTSFENSQLVLPQRIDISTEPLNIEFFGEQIAPTAFIFSTAIPTSTNYAIIKSTLTGGTGSASMLSGRQPSGSTFWNNVQVNFTNIIFQGPSDPTFTMLNLVNEIPGKYTGLLFHNGTVDLPAVVQPTHSNSYAMKLPPVNHSAGCPVRDVVIFGYYNGILAGELSLIGFATFWGCIRPITVTWAYHPSHYGFIGIYWCPYGITMAGAGATGVGGDDGTHYFDVDMLDVENANGQGQSWQNNVYNIDDPSNLWHGSVKWAIINSAVGRIHSIVINGGANIISEEIGTAPTTVAPAFVVGEIGTINSTTADITFSSSIKASDYAAGVVIKVNGSAVTVSSVTRQTTKSHIHAIITPAVSQGDTVQFLYTDLDGFYVNANGIPLADTTQTLTNNVGTVFIVNDAMTDSNGTALASHTPSPTNTPGHAWITGEGTCTIQGNKARGDTSVIISSSHIDTGVADGTITCTVNRSNASDMAIMFRYVDDSNYWLADLQYATGNFNIIEKTANSYTIRGTQTVPGFSANTNYTLQVVLSGTSISATVNGVNTITHTSSVRQTATKHGIWNSNGLSSNPDFDNWQMF